MCTIIYFISCKKRKKLIYIYIHTVDSPLTNIIGGCQNISNIGGYWVIEW